MTNFVKTRTFYKKLPLFKKNSILHVYKKLKPRIWAFIKKSIFGNNRDPWSLPSNPATSKNLKRRRKRNISWNNVYFVLEGVFHIDIVHICMYCPEPFQRLAQCPLSNAIYLPDLLNFINICSQKSWEGPMI